MNTFQLHENVIKSYKDYLQSFINIKDKRIKAKVNEAFENGDFIPDPLIQFNPAFEKGESLSKLANDGLIQGDIPGVFGSYQLYKHQFDAIKIGLEGKGFVVTSGTGSGKSLTYLATIFDYILKLKEKQPGVKAILVYPMNALINSQEEEIRKFHLNYLLEKIKPGNTDEYKKLPLSDAIEKLERNYSIKFPISYRKYTGQEKGDDREAARLNPPDIILTNYMMLELIMTRQSEEWIRSSIQKHLKFLVFDELHTYRGRQGSDVSFLVRRINQLADKELVFIGTSATMITEGDEEERKTAIANVATIISSKPFKKYQIIEESLVHSTNFNGTLPLSYELQLSFDDPILITDSKEIFYNHPFVIWLENAIALDRTNGEIKRGKPLTVREIAELLSNYIEKSIEACEEKIYNILKWSETLNKKGEKCLPFKLHQFISQTSTVYVTLDNIKNRTITIEEGRFVKKGNEDVLIYPVLFSRHSGHEFLCVDLDFENNTIKPRDPENIPEQLTQKKAKSKTLTQADFSTGYLVYQEEGKEDYWSDEQIESLPEAWWTEKNGVANIKSFYEFQIPRKIYFNENGEFSFSGKYENWAWYISAKLRIDLTSGVVYDDIKVNENTKLMRLGNEGRSTATTTITYNVIKQLHLQKEDIKNQKLLSFTDNRQDASLQAGHFNDFLSTVRLRSALNHALKSNPTGLKVYEVTERLAEQLNLKESEFAKEPNNDWPDDENLRALKDYLLVRLFYDLKRGWRYTLPNLEQCSLLKIGYEKLQEFVQIDRFFENIPFFNSIDHQERFEIILQILNYFRTWYAIHHDKIVSQISETENFLKLKLDNSKLWALNPNEKIDVPYYMIVQNPGRTRNRIYTSSLGMRSNLGKYLKRKFNEKGIDFPNGDDYIEFIYSVCDLLVKGNFIKREKIHGRNGEFDGFRLRTDKIIWLPGDEQTVEIDKVRTHIISDIQTKPNEFFKELYKFDFSSYSKPIIGREHTGQLSSDDRITREGLFRQGEISSLFCSPTMELGIDIADLNVVHMRNVPPNPSNYAQRSGRAGRSGQTALVLTYCASMSPHDRNYFKNKEQMVFGSVIPPRIDLYNEELILSHLNAFILMELAIKSIKLSIADVIDLSNKNLIVRKNISDYINDQVNQWGISWKLKFHEIISDIYPSLSNTYWFTESWLEIKINNFFERFSGAFNRWRTLYRNAGSMKSKAQAIIDDPTIKYSSPEKKEAGWQRKFAEHQLALLVNDGNREYGNESEFYVFRYLASEGFLPGYNFTRLPVRAYVGYRYKGEGEYISRPRNLALSEFGPLNLIYHNGSKYRIDKMELVDAESKLRQIKVSKKTSYAFIDEERNNYNNDPITNDELKGEEKVGVFSRTLEISEAEGHPQERISCEEEERMKRGYEIEHYFRYIDGMKSTLQTVVKNASHPLLRIIYCPATELIHINKKWRRSQENNGFQIDKRSGKWLRQRDLDDPETNENAREVQIFARDTAHSLYIQPIEQLNVDKNQIITLSFALKRAIEKLYQIEENEIGVQVMGSTDNPNIMIYESSEGSLGVLSQLVQSPARMKDLFIEAYRTIHYNPATKTDMREDLPKASYDDLLSYYNQIYHDVLDRHSIKEPLELLMDCEVENIQGMRDREEQYKYLLNSYDKNSSTELKFIKFLYENGYVLPDLAQQNLKGYYISVDFVFKTNNGDVLVFCDGSVHDENIVKEDDKHKRETLRDAGYIVIEWHYKEPLEELVKRRKDVFRKIK
jgi:hypothetical protein